jgi:lambda family phage tail tape measure protein
MAKQIEDIIVRLGLEKFEGLDKIRSSFRDLSKVTKMSEQDIIGARDSIFEFAKTAGNSEAVTKGLVSALQGLRSQADFCGDAYRSLADDIRRVGEVQRGATDALMAQRNALVATFSETTRNVRALEEHRAALVRIQEQTRANSRAYDTLSSDIAQVGERITEVTRVATALNVALSRAFPATAAGVRATLTSINAGIELQRQVINEIDLRSGRERRLAATIEERATAEQRLNRALTAQRQLTFGENVRSGREAVRTAAAAFNETTLTTGFYSAERVGQRMGDLPNTTAGLNQELAELSERLVNTTRGSSTYVNVALRMAEIQRQLRTDILGTADAFRQLNIAESGVRRREGKLAGIQEYYATQGPLAPGVGGFRDPATGAMIAAGARTPDRIRVNEAQYALPIGPQAFPEAAKRATTELERAYEDMTRIQTRAGVERVELQAKYNQLQIDKLLEGLDLEGDVRKKAFDTELADFDRRMAIADKRRGRRLTGMQLAQGVGAALSGGIFGGPEGLIGGLGGLALGGVGGAFAGAAAGAQVGMFRQQLGTVTDYSARIDKLQIALRGIVGSQDAYSQALSAAASATRDLNIPQEVAIQGMTRLSAAVKGAGGTVSDSAFAFRAVSEAVKATGGNAEQADGALLALTQVFSKGKVSAEELNQIAERLPGTFTLFAKAAGITGPQLQKALQQGQVGLNDLMKFLQLISTEYGQTALKIADSSQEAGARLSVAMKNMQLEVGRALQPVGAALQNAFVDFITNTTPAAVAACKAIGNALTFIVVDPVGSELAKLTLNVGLATAGVLLLGPALKALAAAFTYAKTQVLALTAAMAKNPLTLLAIAATAAAIKVADVLLNQKRLNDEVQRSLNIASKAPSGSVASQIAKTEYELQAARKKAASELDKASDPFNFGFSAAEAAAQVVRLEDKLVSLKKTYKVRLELDTIFKGIDPTAGVPTGYKIVNGRLAYLSPGQGYIDAETGKPVATGPTKFAEGQADGKDKQASSYLQAFEQREEAITQARLQREEQIAELRKQSLEQARQLERQFADERRALEREIAQSKRGTADIEEDIARQQRLLAGEDPRLIEAEQRIADVYREARERDIKIKEDYTDREFNRARTVADFQKNTADQINKANEAYAKTLGNIHRTYARDVGKILDEASGRTARRLDAAGKLMALYTQRGVFNTQIAEALGVVVAEPGKGGENAMDVNKLIDALGGEKSPRFKQQQRPIRGIMEIDQQIRDARKQLQSRRQQQVTADSFFTAYADQPQFEDIAGLQPFPLQKMLKQIGRPFTRLYNRIESAAESAYPYSRREVKQMLAPDPKRTQRVLERAERVENVRQTWSPVDAEWRQRDNNWRSNPRSKPAAASFSTFEQVLGNLTDTVFKKLNSQGAIYGILGDISDYLSDAQLRIIKTGIMEQLKQGTAPSRLLQHTDGRSSFTSRPNIKSAIKQLTLEAITELQRAGAKNGIAGEYSPLIFDQPRVVPGVGKDFEGAMLPGGFGTSKLARNLGNVASGQLQGVLAGLTNTLIAGRPYRVGDPVGPNIRPIPVQPATKGAPESSAAAKDAAQSQGAKQLALDLAEARTKALEPLQAQTRRLQEQNDLYKAQQTYLQQGITPALAEQFAQVDQLGALQREIAEREKTTAVNKATAANASRAEIDGLIQRHSTLTAQIDSNVQRVKDLAVAYEDAQKAARFTQDERIGLGLREGAEAYVQSIGTMREATAQLAQTGIKGVEDAIFSLTTTGKANFQEFAKSVLESTSRMIIQQLILRSVMQIIGAIGGGSSGGFSFSGAGPVSGASVFGSTQAGFNPLAFSGIKLNALGNAYAANGIVPFAMGGAFQHDVTAYAMGGVVDQPTMFKFADGGAGRLGLMGEAGPEAIMPLRRLPNGRLGVEQAGGGAPVTVNVSVDATGTAVQGNAGQGEQLGRVISQAVQAELVRQQRPGGLLSR